MMNSLYAVFRKYCREHGEELILGAFDQFVFIYFIILLINCEKQRVDFVTVLNLTKVHLIIRRKGIHPYKQEVCSSVLLVFLLYS